MKKTYKKNLVALIFGFGFFAASAQFAGGADAAGGASGNGSGGGFWSRALGSGGSFFSSGLSSSLPIELLTFSAVPIDNSYVFLTWKTATETNNQYFDVERSADMENFKSVSGEDKIPGAGTSSNEHSYDAKDMAPFKGLSYYRLKQIDFDGKYTYSKVEPVNFGSGSLAQLSVFPSPSVPGQNVYVKMNGLPEQEKVLVVLMDVLGQTVFSKGMYSDANGNILEPIDNHIPAGVYTVIGSSDNAIYKQKIMIK